MLQQVVEALRADPVLAGMLPVDDTTGEPAIYTQWSPTSRQPYIVIQHSAAPVGQTSGTVSGGELEINCWDSGSSLARLQAIAYRLEDLLDYSELQTDRGHARVKMQSSGHLQEPEPDTSRWRLMFGTRVLRGAALEARINRPTGLTKININTATAVQLRELPRIGSNTADAIVQFRTTEGPFATIGDVLQVPEVGVKTYDTIKGLITV